MSKDLRKVEVLQENVWKVVRLKDVKKGDTFRMTEDDGEAVTTNSGKTEMVAIGDAYIGPYGPDGTDMWTIGVDDKQT